MQPIYKGKTMHDFLDALQENDLLKTSEGKEFFVVAKRGVSILGYNSDGFEFWDSYNNPSVAASGAIAERLTPKEDKPEFAHEFNQDGSELFTVGGDTALWDTQDGWIISRIDVEPKKKTKA
jgi:hypothetical protein